MDHEPVFSLIVPSRKRIAKLRRFLDSLDATAADLKRIEVILVIDADDEKTLSFVHDRVPLRRVIVAPGRTMGALNQAGYEASTGKYIMLLNDDVIIRTRKWERRIRACLTRYRDNIVLIHVNDTLFQEGMCTFPLVSRTYCELAGGICPADYLRYRIDDHIEQVFNLLGVLGENRIVYLPDVVFEHDKYVEPLPGQRKYFLDERIEKLDEPRFLAHSLTRKNLAIGLKQTIAAGTAKDKELWRGQLDNIENGPALRAIGRCRQESRLTRLLGRLKAHVIHRYRVRGCSKRGLDP